MKKIILLLFVLLSFALVSCDEVFKPLDKIHKYTITVDPNDDGTLDMVYYLKWEVLQEGDGGVDFITVGCYNLSRVIGDRLFPVCANRRIRNSRFSFYISHQIPPSYRS